MAIEIASVPGKGGVGQSEEGITYRSVSSQKQLEFPSLPEPDIYPGLAGELHYVVTATNSIQAAPI